MSIEDPWFRKYERDVKGQPGAARYTRPARTVSSRSLQPDSGIPAPSAHMTRVEPPDPAATSNGRHMVGELLRGFIKGLFAHAFGGIGGHGRQP